LLKSGAMDFKKGYRNRSASESLLFKIKISSLLSSLHYQIGSFIISCEKDILLITQSIKFASDEDNVLYIWLLSGLFSTAILTRKAIATSHNDKIEIKTDTLTLYDKSRKRIIPLALYKPLKERKITRQKVVIFSHGYYKNMPDGYKRAS